LSLLFLIFREKKEVETLYYKVLIEGGHMGAGRSYDFTPYFKADNLNALYRSLNKLSRIKSRSGLRTVREVIPVSRENFM
jgi:hypothetical protein